MASSNQPALAETSILPSPTVFARATEVVTLLRKTLPQPLHSPVIGIVCGSGLGNLQYSLLAAPSPRVEFSYAEIPHFPQSSVLGHDGKMVFGYMKGNGGANVPVVLLVGRVHFYEGHSMELVTFAMRVLRVFNVKRVFRERSYVTNAAGGLNPDYAVGDIVLLADHINLAGLTGTHPLRGPNDEDFGTRFPPLSDAYDLDLRRRAHCAWRDLVTTTTHEKRLHEGVYSFVGGPSYETRAECRMLRAQGADVVGMSTVPEVITARHCGMKVMAMSLVTNKSVLDAGPRGDDLALDGMGETELEEYLGQGKANHKEVLEEGKRAALIMQALIERIVEGLEVL